MDSDSVACALAALSNDDLARLRLAADASPPVVRGLSAYIDYAADWEEHLDAAIIGVLQVLEQVTVVERIVAAVLAGFVVKLTWPLVAELGEDIEVRRARLEGAIDRFGNAFQEAWAAKLKPRDHGEGDVERLSRVMRFAIAAAAGVTAWVSIRPLLSLG